MRAEGMRVLVATGCVAPREIGSVPADWNDVFDTPAGACLGSRLVAGDPAARGLLVYMKAMNQQKAAQGCPPTQGKRESR